MLFFFRLHVNLSNNESVDGNGTIEVALDPVPEREAVSCNLAVLPVESMARWKVGVADNITLKDELLLAGVHIFSGKYINIFFFCILKFSLKICNFVIP